MRQLRLLPITAIAVLGFTAVSHIGASAISLPTDPITFDLNITPPANKPGKNPNSAACIPLSATANPKANPNANLKRKNGLSNVAGVCNIQRVVPARAWTGTASSTQLAVLDAGFANGTYEARCNSQRQLAKSLILMQPNATPRLVKDSPLAFTACRFTLSFADAQASTLTGTIQITIKIGTDTQIVVGETIPVTYSASTTVTAGTGTFTGLVGTGTYSPAQTINLSILRGGAGVNAARLRATVVRSVMTSTQMTVTLVNQ